MGKKKTVAPATTSPKTRNKTPPFPNYPEWSSAKFWGFLRSGLRATYNKWPPKWEVLKAAKRPYSGKGKQQKWEYQCAECQRWYKQKDVSVDHVIPAGSLSGFEDIAGFVERLFIGADGLQVLCSDCHQAKTQKERK